MKSKIKILICALLTLVIAIPTICLFSSADGSKDEVFISADVECTYNDFNYIIDSDGCVYREDNMGNNHTVFEDVIAEKIAVLNGLIYYLHKDVISAFNLETGELYTVIDSENNVTAFTVTESRIYILSDGKIVYRRLSGGLVHSIVSDALVTDFWLEDGSTISYVTDGDLIYTVNLENDETTSKFNCRTDIGNAYVVNSSDDTENDRSKASLSLTSLKQKFPDGKYWNHVNISSNNPDGYTNHACVEHKGYVSSTCNSYYGCYQCMGYAFQCGYDLTGYNPKLLKNGWKLSSDSASVDTVKAGDIIRYRNDGHSIFVTAVSGNTISYTDCNSKWVCNIRWGATVSKSTVKASFTKLYSSPYSVSVYTVNLDGNGGQVSKTNLSLVGDEKFGELPTPEREGYGFEGWYTKQTGGTQVTADTIFEPDKYTTLYAHWLVYKYKVSYNANMYDPVGNPVDVGNMPTDQTKDYDSSVNIKSGPNCSGYSFRKWNTEPDGSGTDYSTSYRYSANADLVLYAIWSPNSYEVKFDANGGTCSESSKRYTYGKPYSEKGLPTPTRPGYEFLGWYTSKEIYVKDNTGAYVLDDNGQKIVSCDMVSEDDIHMSVYITTLYAQWDYIKYSVKYNANAGSDTVTGMPDNENKIHDISYTISSKIPTRKGFNFLGWSLKSDATDGDVKYSAGKTYTDNKELELFAIWERIKFTITFDKNCEDNSVSNLPVATQKQYGINLKLSSNAPKRTGYSFSNWNTKQNGTGTAYKAGSEFNVDAKTTLYAIWTANKYNVTFDANGGSIYPEDRAYAFDSVYGELPITTWTGHEFKGWSLTNEKPYQMIIATDIVKITSDTVFYAVWNDSKVSFNTNGGTPNVPDQYCGIGEKISYPEVDPSCQGKVFIGWYNSLGERLVKNVTVAKGQNVTFGAIYVDSSVVNVYVANGSILSTVSKPDDKDVPTVSNMKFSGEWSKTEINGVNVYSAEYTTDKYEIEFSFYPYDEANTKKFSLPVGSVIQQPEIQQRAGYYFIGWDKEVPATMPASNLKFTAKYNAKKYFAEFYAQGNLLKRVEYTLDDKDIKDKEPEIPSKTGYTSKWPSYELLPQNMKINAVYETIKYHIAFYADDVLIDTVEFTIESKSINEPEIPQKEGCVGTWEAYVLIPQDFSVKCIYVRDCYISSNYPKTKIIGKWSNLTCSVSLKGTKGTAEIIWFKDGQKITPNSDGKVVIKNIQSNFTIKAQLVENGEVLDETETMNVQVNSSFISIVKSFFKMLFGNNNFEQK